MALYFEYGDQELTYLSARDEALKAAIQRIGFVERAVEPDLFRSVIHQIVGQQISVSAQRTVWARMGEAMGIITPEAICALSPAEIQRFGVTHKKAGSIRAFAEKVRDGSFSLDALHGMSDADAIAKLCTLEGVGVWTAEMILIFSMRRADVVSFGDLGIRRGMSLLYGYEKVTRELFEKHRAVYSPYGSVASLYLWAVSAGL